MHDTYLVLLRILSETLVAKQRYGGSFPGRSLGINYKIRITLCTGEFIFLLLLFVTGTYTGYRKLEVGSLFPSGREKYVKHFEWQTATLSLSYSLSIEKNNRVNAFTQQATQIFFTLVNCLCLEGTVKSSNLIKNIAINLCTKSTC